MLTESSGPGKTDIISTAKGLTRLSSVDELPGRLEPAGILMSPPDYFTVRDVKNQFMQGQIAQVDHQLARQQWNVLRELFERLSAPVSVIDAQVDLEDMVFCANQALVGMSDSGTRFAVMSKMRHQSRQQEVPHFDRWFREHGYQVMEPFRTESDTASSITRDSAAIYFEGHGDALWHSDRMLLWGGWGHRTSRQAYPILSKLIDAPIITLELVNPKFYHLDTAFCVINRHTVLIYPAAFSREGLSIVKSVFDNVVEASDEDANNLACNALAIGDNVIIQKGCKDTCKKLEALGFKIVEASTSEFMKSGGSVFCLKSQIYTEAQAKR